MVEQRNVAAEREQEVSPAKRAAGKDWGAGKFIVAALIVGLVVGALAIYLLAGASGPNLQKTKVFEVTAYHWAYDPQTLEVNQGDLVVIVLRSAGSNHELHEIYEEAEVEYLELIGYNMTEWEEEEEADPTLRIHGFRLEAFGIEVDMPLDAPDDIVVVKFIADKTGTFTFRCSNDCGPGHDQMKGTLIVR